MFRNVKSEEDLVVMNQPQRKLFLWFESHGTDLTDWPGLPLDPISLETLFDVVVILAPNKMILDSTNPNISTPQQELDMFTAVEALLPSTMRSERWITLYFGQPGDGLPQLSPCNIIASDHSTCMSGVQTYLTAYKNWNGWGAKKGPVGIAYDDEFGELQVQLMRTAQLGLPTDTEMMSCPSL